MITWALSVFSSVFFASVISFLLPSGKISKFVKPILSVIVLFVIISPIVNYSEIFESVNQETNLQDVFIDQNFLNSVGEYKIGIYREKCFEIAKKNGITGEDILIKYNIDDRGKLQILGVDINLKNAVISSEEEHIVILRRVAEEIGDVFGIESSGVSYER